MSGPGRECQFATAPGSWPSAPGLGQQKAAFRSCRDVALLVGYYRTRPSAHSKS